MWIIGCGSLDFVFITSVVGLGICFCKAQWSSDIQICVGYMGVVWFVETIIPFCVHCA